MSQVRASGSPMASPEHGFHLEPGPWWSMKGSHQSGPLVSWGLPWLLQSVPTPRPRDSCKPVRVILLKILQRPSLWPSVAAPLGHSPATQASRLWSSQLVHALGPPVLPGPSHHLMNAGVSFRAPEPRVPLCLSFYHSANHTPRGARLAVFTVLCVWTERDSLRVCGLRCAPLLEEPRLQGSSVLGPRVN